MRPTLEPKTNAFPTQPRGRVFRRVQRASSYACALTLAALLAACSDRQAEPFAPTLAASNTPADPAAPATLGWNEQARALVAANNFSPPAAARIYAAVAVGQYAALSRGEATCGRDDATVSAAGDLRINGDDAVTESEGTCRTAGWQRGAVAGASANVLAFFFPAAAPTLEQRVLDEGGDNPRFARGLAVGRRQGNRIIERLRVDHFTDPWTGSVPVGPGKWRNNGPPAAPMLGGVTPYFMTSGDQFRPPPPPAFGSEEFLAGLQEVREISDTRTDRQLEIALQWNYGAGTSTPLGVWNEIAAGYIVKYELGEFAAAHVLALMHTAMMDAFIGCWDAKYFYWLLRPSQADAAITLPIGLPNHPSYPSGHSCSSGAATTVLAEFFPDHRAELRRQMIQAGNSRIFGGIHYRFDVTTGQDLGKAAARLALRIDAEDGLLSVLD